jgi:uncharacterized protein (TIGR02266 family)
VPRRPVPGAASQHSEPERVARILLVDDTRRFIDLLKNYLRRTTCRIVSVRTGSEALAFCRQDRPDLVFLDEAMTEMDGLEVCRALKADPLLKSVPVVIVTARDRVGECRGAGCDEVVVKPVRQKDFLETVRRFAPLRERLEDRIPISLRVEFTVRSAAYSAFTKDLSPHGMFLKSPRPFAPGTRMQITLHLPGGRPALRLEGEVRRVVETAPGGQLIAGIGLRFTEVDPETLKALQEFIAERRPG